MRISLLYRGEYSQWRERFMNNLEAQTDGESMINSIENGDHPLPIVAQVSLAGTAPNAIPTLKDLKQTKNLMEINIDALYNILKQNQGDVNGALGYKKKVVVVTSDALTLIAEKTKVSKRKEKVEVQMEYEGSDAENIRHFSKDCKKAKVKEYNYYKTKMLLAKNDNDEKVLLVEDQAWMES
nr:hypothetical protein [Tanacetum cinerariifolium]